MLLSRDVEALLNRGVSRNNLGCITEAAAAWQRLLEIDPGIEHTRELIDTLAHATR